MSDSQKPKTKPIVDVAHPGKSAPSSTSRPVIVTNRPVLKDPMMTDNSGTYSSEIALDEKDTIARPTAKATLQPIEEGSVEPAEKTDEKPESKTSFANQADESQEQPAEETAEEAEKMLDAETEKQAKHDAAIQKLTDSRQYELPIGTSEKRKTKRFIVLGIVLSVLLAVAWVDIALDANLIQIDTVKPVTHFFSN